MPIGFLCLGMEEINGLQRGGWNASFIAGPNLGCSGRRQRQPAETATSNSRCPQPSSTCVGAGGGVFKNLPLAHISII
jgi:hypothetical protein